MFVFISNGEETKTLSMKSLTIQDMIELSLNGWEVIDYFKC
jgi:hypothetical protein